MNNPRSQYIGFSVRLLELLLSLVDIIKMTEQCTTLNETWMQIGKITVVLASPNAHKKCTLSTRGIYRGTYSRIIPRNVLEEKLSKVAETK